MGSYFAYLFFKKNAISEQTSFYLALLYNCSFWSVAIFSYINHTNYLLYVPLMLLIAENMIEGKRYARISMFALLTLSLMNSLIYSFNFSVLAFIYISVKSYFYTKSDLRFKKVTKVLFEWVVINVLAVMASSIIILPQIMLVLDTTRAAAHLTDNFFLYILETTLNILTPNFLVLNGFRLPYGMEISSFVSYIGVPLVVYGFIQSKKMEQSHNFKTAKWVLTILLVILYLLPLNNALNLFTGTYQRWTLFLVIFQLMMVGYGLDYLKNNYKDVKWIILGSSSVAMMGTYLNYYFMANAENPIGINQDQIISFVFGLVIILIFYLFKKSEKLLNYLLIINLLAIYSLMGLYHYYCSDNYPIRSDYQTNGAYSSVANRGVIYGGSAQLYYNSFVNNRMANRTTVLTYSKTLQEIADMGIDTALAMARDYNPGMQYLLASPYVEKFSLTLDGQCYENQYCLTPTGYTETKGVVLDKDKTISLKDFKELSFTEKNKSILENLITDKTTIILPAKNNIDMSKYWSKEDNWYTHVFIEGENRPVLYAQTSTYFCVNKTEDDCALFSEMTYFDTDIEGIESISVSTRKLKIKYRNGDLPEPYVEILPQESFRLPENTADYIWIDSNKLIVNLRSVEDNGVVMLPIAYDKNFVIMNESQIQLKDIQLGMLGLDNINNEEFVIIEYRPSYISIIPWIYLVLSAIFTVILIINRKENIL